MNASIPDNRENPADAPAAEPPRADTAISPEPLIPASGKDALPEDIAPEAAPKAPETVTPAAFSAASDISEDSGVPRSLRDCAPELAEVPDNVPEDSESAAPEPGSGDGCASEDPGAAGSSDTPAAETAGESKTVSADIPASSISAAFLPESSPKSADPDDSAPENIPDNPKLPEKDTLNSISPAAALRQRIKERRTIDPLLFVTYSGKPEAGDYSETPPAARNPAESLTDAEQADTTWLRALPYSVGAIVHTITNSRGNTVSVMDWGATVLDFSVWDSDKKLVYHPVLGTRPSRYQEQRIQLGATVGRVANRIAHGRFELNGTSYSLVRDSGYEHTLHGGITGFSEKRFEFTNVSPSSVTLKLISPDMDNGFPGNLTLQVTYTLDDDNALRIDYEAVSSRDTPINITSHIYWNLSLRNSLEGQFLKAENAVILNTDNTGIPDGTVSTQEESPLDFSGILPLSYNIEAATECYPFGGIDHVLAFRDPRLPGDAGIWDTPDTDSTPVTRLCELYCPETMLTLEVYSDYPALQVYSGNALEGVPGRNEDKVYRNHEGIALEPEYFPDAINHPEFQARCPVLRAGKTFRKSIVYKIVQNRIPEILEPLEVLEEELAALEAQERLAGEPFFRDVYSENATDTETPECRELPAKPAVPETAEKRGGAPAPKQVSSESSGTGSAPAAAATPAPAPDAVSGSGTKPEPEVPVAAKISAAAETAPQVPYPKAPVSGPRKSGNPFFRDTAPEPRDEEPSALPGSADTVRL